jgi:hypothetical protein
VGVPIAAATGIVAGAIFGLAYVYVLNWIPFIYVSFLATLGFGFAVGAAVAWGARIGKIRNMAVSLALGGLVGLVAVYFAWVFDPMARIEDVQLPFWQLEQIWIYMKLGYAVGFWGIGQNGGPVTGPFLAGVWIVEAAIIVGICVVAVHSLLGERPFCEETGQWTKSEANVARLSLSEDEGVEEKLKRLLAGDLSSLADFYRTGDDDPAVLQFDLATCPDCPTCNFLTVKMIQTVVNKKGEATKQESKLLVNLRIRPEDLEAVRTAGIDRPPLAGEELAAETDDEKLAT